MKTPSKPVTSPAWDVCMGIAGGIACLAIGGGMLADGRHWQVGATILVGAVASFMSAWRLSRRRS